MLLLPIFHYQETHLRFVLMLPKDKVKFQVLSRQIVNQTDNNEVLHNRILSVRMLLLPTFRYQEIHLQFVLMPHRLKIQGLSRNIANPTDNKLNRLRLQLSLYRHMNKLHHINRINKVCQLQSQLGSLLEARAQ
jgi:hypothetical protein